MKRREFIILSGVGATGASLLTACGHPEEKLIPVLIPDDEFVPGVDYWKASTCRLCSAGCGIVVRTREHRANKIEGNPFHPVNRGTLCARGQAGLELLYNPDRITKPLKRAGERGEGKWQEVSWDQALSELTTRLRDIKAKGSADKVALAVDTTGGVTGLASELFMSAYGSPLLIAEDVLDHAWAQLGHSESQPQGPSRMPVFDIANCRYLLSFGARFLESWVSPVLYSRAYAEFRRATNKPRGKFVQIEPRMSMTGANADEWIPARAGSHRLIAWAIAQVIVREKLVSNVPPLPQGFPEDGSHGTTPGDVASFLERYAPEGIAESSGIEPDQIIRIAREFAGSGASLAVGDGLILTGPNKQTADWFDQKLAINYLNTLAGNLEKPGGLSFRNRAADPFQLLRTSSAINWQPLPRSQMSGPLEALLLAGSNPVYQAPQLKPLIASVPFIAACTAFLDESASLADLILPVDSYLESWDLLPVASAGDAVASIGRPVVKRAYDTKSAAEILLVLAREFGSSVETSPELLIKSVAERISGKHDSQDWWDTTLERGVLTTTGSASPTEQERAAPIALSERSSAGTSATVRALSGMIEFARDSQHGEGYDVTLIAYEPGALGSGQPAILPTLQELPDPMTSVMWGSWVEINPRTAESLGIKDGDVLEVRTANGAVTAPALIYPGIRPDTIAMPYGQGHGQYGRYASRRGVNVCELIPRNVNPFGETLAVPARVTRVGSGGQLIRFGTELMEHMESRR